MLQQLWICVKKILLNLTWEEFVLMDLSKELMEFVFFYGFQHCNVSVFPVSLFRFFLISLRLENANDDFQDKEKLAWKGHDVLISY